MKKILFLLLTTLATLKSQIRLTRHSVNSLIPGIFISIMILTGLLATTSLYSQSARQPQSEIVNQQSKIATQSKIVNQQSEISTIEGSWILDSAIIETTDEDGYVIGTSIYLLGDTLMTSEHPQPPQRVVITAKEVIFEYSSPISYRSTIEHIRKGEYTFDGRRLWICFAFAEEFICHRRDDERLHLHYDCSLTDGVKQFTERGVFKLKAEKSKDIKIDNTTGTMDNK